LGARFLTRDPLEALTRSPYAYAWNNPVSFTDPTGLIGFPHLPSPGDLIHGLVDPIVDGTKEVVQEVNEHITINYSACLGYCFGVTYNHGRFYTTRGWGGIQVPGPIPNVGWTSKPYDDVCDPSFLSAGAELVYGGSISGNSEYVEVTVGTGFGFFGILEGTTDPWLTLPGFG
jgi:hypothetical protein